MDISWQQATHEKPLTQLSLVHSWDFHFFTWEIHGNFSDFSPVVYNNCIKSKMGPITIFHVDIMVRTYSNPLLRKKLYSITMSG